MNKIVKGCAIGGLVGITIFSVGGTVKNLLKQGKFELYKSSNSSISCHELVVVQITPNSKTTNKEFVSKYMHGDNLKDGSYVEFKEPIGLINEKILFIKSQI